MTARADQDAWVTRVLGYAFAAQTEGAAGGAGGRTVMLWQVAKDAADAQLNELYRVLRTSRIDVLAEVADEIEQVLEGYRVGIVAALFSYDGAAGPAREPARQKALDAVTAARARLAQDKHVIAADTNPFGVQVEVGATLAGALSQLEKRLAG